VNGFLLDTNVISEFTKQLPDPGVISWLKAADPETLFVSVVTYGEIRLGIEDLPRGKRRAALEEWFRGGLPDWFESNLLPVTRAIADRWGRLTIEAKRRGASIATADGLIGATGIVHGLVLATRNGRDFAGTGATTFSPWELRA
jgi:predicted nucleic acid-binding protein